jgi:hypothetical protein
MNDFVPVIVSVGFLSTVFLFAYVCDVRRVRRQKEAKRQPAQIRSLERKESVTVMPMRQGDRLSR